MRLIILLVTMMMVTFNASAQNVSANRDSIQASVRQLMATYPEARLQDIYKNFYQDRFGPGHLLADTVAAKRYLEKELATSETFGGPLYEPTGWCHQFYRVNLSVVKQGIVDKDIYYDAFYSSTLSVPPFTDDQWREEWQIVLAVVNTLPIKPTDYQADSLAIDSMMRTKPQAVHHSRSYNSAYHPHYRIIAKDIFINELMPLIKKRCCKTE